VIRMALLGLGAVAVGAALTSCQAETCAEPVECVRSCGGPIEQSGCDPCPSGTFVRTLCEDGGTDAGQYEGIPDGGDAGADGGDGGL
jgi:hypothetical protein